jgi:hypothetical protein
VPINHGLWGGSPLGFFVGISQKSGLVRIGEVGMIRSVNGSYSSRRRRILFLEVSQWVLNCLIVAGIVTGVFFGYAGFFWTGLSMFVGVVFLAAFRFYDFEAASRPTGASGELNPDPAHGACVAHSDDGAGGDDGGSD